MENKVVLSLLFSFLVLLSVIIVIWIVHQPEGENQACFKEYCFNLELAVTDYEKIQGLMFREHLDFSKGMLFVFDEEGEYSFWMKNTLIPLDVIWINKEKEVVFIKENFQPCEKEPCLRVTPDKNAKYVLEVQGGAVDKIGLSVGDKLNLYLK